MKKFILLFLLVIYGISGFPQRFKVVTNPSQATYKKHYSASIEGGYVNGQAREVIVGNATDLGINSQFISGNTIETNNFFPLKIVDVGITARIQLTDFTIYPNGEVQYVAGTGVYYPTGVNGMGYPFLGIYERGTMQLISIVYYDLSYPGNDVTRTAAGLRIKYSSAANAFYISGVMSDRRFIDLNLNTLLGKSKGFIMKIEANNMNNPQVLVFNPDNLPGTPEPPVLSAVTDMELTSDESLIAFTGINTKQQLPGFYHPMVGMIDRNLNIQWSKVYQFEGDRYSGVDVEFNTTTNRLLVLMNAGANPFAVMELDYNGTITQQPVNYEFTLSSIGKARAHIMHYTGSGIIITGNCFVGTDQLLFNYEIPLATNLLSGYNYFNSYSRELIPLGSQEEVTNFWAPENSIYQDGNLSIVGIYNNNNTSFGYTLIHVNSFVNQTGCLETGSVSKKTLSTQQFDITTYLTNCNKIDFNADISPPQPIDPIQECPRVGGGKSIKADPEGIPAEQQLFRYVTSDYGGIHAITSSSGEKQISIRIYDVVGRNVYNESFNLDQGEKNVYLKFPTHTGIYLIRVNDGVSDKTYKVYLK